MQKKKEKSKKVKKEKKEKKEREDWCRLLWGILMHSGFNHLVYSFTPYSVIL